MILNRRRQSEELNTKIANCSLSPHNVLPLLGELQFSSDERVLKKTPVAFSVKVTLIWKKCGRGKKVKRGGARQRRRFPGWGEYCGENGKTGVEGGERGGEQVGGAIQEID